MASSASSSLDPSLVTLLGEELYTADGKVATSEALNGVDFVMLYVGALSTPSFTSKLAAYWSKHHTDKSFATVFVSVDNKAADFASAFAGMPWNLALPFGAKDRLGAIARRFKITGAPTVVILDAVSGNEITSDAAGAINADPDATSFPYKPPSVWDVLAGATIKAKDGSVVDAKALRSANDYVGLYFSASWCPPCQRFTPSLISWYNKLRAPGGKGVQPGTTMDLIFVSSDRAKGDFEGYYRKMPFNCIAFEDRQGAGSLGAKFGINGIPALVFINKAGDVVTKDGTSKVMGAPEDFPWPPKPVYTLDESVDTINDIPTAILFADTCSDDAAIAAASAAFNSVAEEMFTSSGGAIAEKLRFAVASESEDDATLSVRQFLKLTKDRSGPTSIRVVIVDVQGAKKALFKGGEMGVPSVPELKAFVDAFLAGEGTVSIKA